MMPKLRIYECNVTFDIHEILNFYGLRDFNSTVNYEVSKFRTLSLNNFFDNALYQENHIQNCFISKCSTSLHRKWILF